MTSVWSVCRIPKDPNFKDHSYILSKRYGNAPKDQETRAHFSNSIEVKRLVQDFCWDKGNSKEGFKTTRAT